VVNGDLQRWLKWLGTPDCTCKSQWKSLGRLYGVSMGKGWVRVSTDPACIHHNEKDLVRAKVAPYPPAETLAL
jgi:hypothetical protein